MVNYDAIYCLTVTDYLLNSLRIFLISLIKSNTCFERRFCS